MNVCIMVKGEKLMSNLNDLSVEELFSMLPSSIKIPIEKKCSCGNRHNEIREYCLRVDVSTEYGKDIRNKYDVNYSDWTKDLFSLYYQSSLKKALINAIENLKSVGFEKKLLPVRKDF